VPVVFTFRQLPRSIRCAADEGFTALVRRDDDNSTRRMQIS
jgi:hypothetical protein